MNTQTIKNLILVVFVLAGVDACSSSVGGNEDRSAGTITLTSLNDGNGGEDVIGTFTITWDNTEVNRSTVDIELSSDSGETFDTVVVNNAPDTGSYAWDSNAVADCRHCRIRITGSDAVGNVTEPAVSAEDFVVNNVPQVLGVATYRDIGADGPGPGDQIIVPFDKDLVLRTQIASDIFFFQVVGDGAGPFATVAQGEKPNELVLIMDDNYYANFHLHIRGLFNQEFIARTSPSGINLHDIIPEGVVFASDTGRTASSAAEGIDIVPSYSDTAQSLGMESTLSIDVGDVDGDGNLDFVTGNGSTYFVEANGVWIGDGTGAFSDSGQTLGSDATFAIKLVDVDADGDLDIISGNDLGPNRVWTNVAGTFTDTMQALGNRNTYSLAVGDIDNDGDPDFIAGNYTENTVWINNSGTFTDSGQLLGNSSTFALALGDLDGDGDLDLVAGNNNFGLPQADTVWFNNGGSFTNSGQALGNTSTNSIALADIDRDGDLDLVTGNENSADIVWLNDGKGVFTDSGQRLGSGNTVAIVLDDYDRDGDIDFYSITTNKDNGSGRTWVNDGTGVFSDSGQVNEYSTDLAAAVLGDVDNDGDRDIIAGNLFATPNNVYKSSLLPPDNKSFYVSNQVLSNNNVTAIALVDVDADADLDIITGNADTLTNKDEPNRVWLNDGTGVFVDSGQLLGNSRTYSIAAADVDGDGDIDFVAGNNNLSQPSILWLNNGAGVFTDSGQQLATNAYSIALVDVNRDNRPDLIVGKNSSQANEVWLNNGSGTFSNSGQALGNYSTRSIALADLNGDSYPDLVTGNWGANLPTKVWFNDGNGTFTDSGQSYGIARTNAVALADVDGDGDKDIIEGNSDGNTGLPDAIWLNDGKGVFTSSGQSLGTSLTVAIAVADFDGDGDRDFITANGGRSAATQSNTIWRGGGTGFFTEAYEPFSIMETNNTSSLVVGDVDGDGDLDVVEGNQGVGIRVLLGD